MRRRRLTGTLRAAVPMPEALRLFTPEGEREWAHGWDPRYPEGDGADDTAPGTVFETGDGRTATVWLVLDRRPDGYRYARITPGCRAGIVDVRCRADGADTLVEVSYDLTALSAAGAEELERFAEGYDAFLADWQRLIEASR